MKTLIATAGLTIMFLSAGAFAGSNDKAATIAKINKGEGGFRDRDLYPFCATLDGNTTAHPTHVGQNLKALKDKKGKAFGAEMFKVAEEGKVKQVSYLWPKPGSDVPVEKVVVGVDGRVMSRTAM